MERDLTKGSVRKHLKYLAIPASIGFFFHTMYNVVDTYFAGLISTDALAALSLSFPLFFVLIAFSSGTSSGATSLISNALGRNEKEEAKIFAAQSISFSFILSIFITIFGLLSSPMLFRFMGAEDRYLKLTLDYMNIILYGTVTFLVGTVFNGIISSKGNLKPYRNFLISSFVFNLILDPWFMFGGMGIPPLGISGIAFATVLIQTCGTLYLLYCLFKTDLIDSNTWQNLIPSRKYYRELFWQCMPASFNMLTVSLGYFVLTYFVGTFSEEAVAAFGIGTRIEQIVLLPSIGLNIAALSIVGHNSGAMKFKRIYQTWRKGIHYGMMITFPGMLLIFFAAKPLMQMFTSDPLVVELGIPYLRIASFLLWSYVILFLSVACLQGMKKPIYGLILGLLRQAILPVPIIYIFIKNFNLGLSGVWWGNFIVTWSAAFVTLYYFGRVIKKKVQN